MPTDWERRVTALVAKGKPATRDPKSAAFLEDRLKGKGSLGITGVLRIGLAVAEAPEANPATCCRAPLSRQWESMRSIRYGASPTSSSSRITPRRSGRWGAQQMGGDGEIAHQARAFRLTRPPRRSGRRAMAPKRQARRRSWLHAGSAARLVTSVRGSPRYACLPGQSRR